MTAAESVRNYLSDDDRAYFDLRSKAREEARQRFSKVFDQDLYDALHGINRSELRWIDRRAKGSTDEDLLEAIKYEFGSFSGSTGHGGDSIGYEVTGDRFYRPSRYQAKVPTLHGAALIREVRRLMQIDFPQSTEGQLLFNWGAQ